VGLLGRNSAFEDDTNLGFGDGKMEVRTQNVLTRDEEQ